MSINTDDNIWSSIEKLDIPKMFTLFSILFLLLSNFYLILYYDFFGISIYSYISPSEILLLIMPNLVIVIVSVLVILAIITTPIIGLALLTRALRNFIFYPLLRIIYKLILKKEYNKIDNIADNRNDTNFFENNTLLQYLIIVYILLYQGFFYLNEPFGKNYDNISSFVLTFILFVPMLFWIDNTFSNKYYSWIILVLSMTYLLARVNSETVKNGTNYIDDDETYHVNYKRNNKNLYYTPIEAIGETNKYVFLYHARMSIIIDKTNLSDTVEIHNNYEYFGLEKEN